MHPQLAFRPAESVPLRPTRKRQEDKWHDQIMLDKVTEGTRYPPPYEQIAINKRKKFSRAV